MPNIKSAAKRMRQNARRRAANRSKRSMMRTSIKKLYTAVEQGDAQAAAAQLAETASVIGKMASKGIIHKNNAARRISRLSRRVAALARTQQPAEG